MQQIRDAVNLAANDSLSTLDGRTETVGQNVQDTQDAIVDIVSRAATELDKHVPESSPFKPFVISGLQMVAAFAIKSIFRRH